MTHIFYMILGVGIFAAVVAHAFVGPRYETRATQRQCEKYPSSPAGLPRRHAN